MLHWDSKTAGKRTTHNKFLSDASTACDCTDPGGVCCMFYAISRPACVADRIKIS